MNGVTNRPHDALFKASFEDVSQISGLYCGAYPPAVCERIDWSSVKPAVASFVDDWLDDGHTDLLFHARMRTSKGESKQVYLYLLLEHQSTNDRTCRCGSTTISVRSTRSSIER